MSGAGNGLVPTPPPIFDGIPPGLRLLVHWIMWRWMPPPGTKVPVTIDGFGTKWSEPARWSTFDAIRDRFEKVGKGRFSGVGVWLGDVNDAFDTRFLWGIDIDSCLAPDRALLPWAVAIVGLLGNASYIEISPSGTGLKAFFLSSKAELRAMRTALGMIGLETMGRKFAMPGDGAHPPAVELYFGKRYFAVTGNRWAGSCGDVEEVGVSLITTLLPMLPVKAANGANGAKPGPKPKDMSRSAKAFGAVANRIRMGAIAADVEAVREALAACGDPDVVAWLDEKGTDHEISNIIRNALAGEEPPADWLQSDELTRGAKGGLHCNLHNTLVALRFAPELRGVFAFDEMARLVAVTSDLLGDGDKVPRWIRDTDYTAVQVWLQKHAFMTTLGRETVIHAVAMAAEKHRFHPVRDYLNGLTWDGVHRLDDWMVVHAKAEPSVYVSLVSRMMLLAMVARIFEPGCKSDYCVVLEGPLTGEQKSSMLAVLGDRWFTDHLPDIHSKDASEHIAGRWLCEIPEMGAVKRADLEHTKAFLSRTTEIYRKSYGRSQSHEPRQCIFVGTTNRTVYLLDETGNRRFWPVRIGAIIDLEGLKAARDQLFAEAVHRYRAGEHWWPDREDERIHFAPQQAARFDVDLWEEPVLEYLEGKPSVTIWQVIMGVEKLGFKSMLAKATRADGNRVMAILTRAGWANRGKARSQRKNAMGRTGFNVINRLQLRS